LTALHVLYEGQLSTKPALNSFANAHMILGDIAGLRKSLLPQLDDAEEDRGDDDAAKLQGNPLISSPKGEHWLESCTVINC